MISEMQQQLQQIKEMWERISNVPPDLTSWGFPGLTRIAISDVLGGMVEIAAQIDKVEESMVPQLSIFVLRQNITGLRSYVSQHIPQNPQPHIPGFISSIEIVRIGLLNLLESIDKNGKQATKNLLRFLAETVSKIKDAEQLHKNLLDANEDVLNIAEKAKSDSSAIQAYREMSESRLKEANELSTEISDYHKVVIANADQVKEEVSELGELKDELDENRAKQAVLFEKFEAYAKEINDLIGAASQVGMAASFRLMKVDFERGLRGWLIAFVGAVLVLAEIGVLYLAPAVSSKDWIDILIKLPLTFPLIWLGWFFAKQYGYTARLREDYAFKYAAAMSFEAHKREAREIDEELLKKLLEISIQNFADNPLRIFGGANHASPAHEFWESLFKDDKLTGRLKDIKALFATDKTD